MPKLLRLRDVRATAEGEQPPGYRRGGVATMNIGVLSVLSLVLIIPAFLFFAWVTEPLGGPIPLAKGGGHFTVGLVDLVLLTLVALVVLPVIHELLHGLVASLNGARPVYGIGPGVAFCHVRELVSRPAYTAILLAPLVVISVVGVLLMPLTPGLLRGQLLALLVLNAAGAVGDLLMFWQLRSVPRHALLADTNAGFEWYLPPDLAAGPKAV